jgi:hypothetical protein
MAYAKRKAPPKKRVVKRTKKGSGKLVKLIKKVAAEQVHRQIENKQQSYDLALTTFNNAATGFGDQLRVMPFINLGVNAADRTGDTITLRSLRILGHMVVNPAILTADNARQRIMVRMVILQPKTFGTYTTMQANAGFMDTVLRNGNSTQSMDGSIKSMYLPYNYEAFRIYAAKRVILRSDAIIGNGIINGQYATSFFSFNMKVKNKKVKYNDTSSEPMAFCPIMLLSYCFLDGSATSLLSTAVSMSFNSTVVYEDA